METKTEMAICFYSNQSNSEWYKVDLQMWIEKRYPNGRVDFEKWDKIDFHISKDSTYQTYSSRVECGRNGITLHWAQNAADLVKDITRTFTVGPEYKVVSLAYYQRIRRVCLAIIKQHQLQYLPFEELVDAFDFTQEKQLKQLPSEQRKLKGGSHE